MRNLLCCGYSLIIVFPIWETPDMRSAEFLYGDKFMWLEPGELRVTVLSLI